MLAIAVILLAGLSYCQFPAKADYARKAEQVTDYIQSHFYDPAQKRYHPEYPLEKGKLPWDMMWANGIALGMLVDATKCDSKKYKPILYDFTNGLNEYYWDPTAPVPAYNAYCSGPGGGDKFYDDNEWIVLDFVDAYDATKDPSFLSLARRTQAFVLSGWDSALGGGIYWKVDHQQKNACSNNPAAAGCFRIAQETGDTQQIGWGLTIRKWTNRRLQDPSGLFWDHIDLDGKVEHFEWTYNTAMMMWANLLYYQLSGDRPSLAEAKRLADESLAHWSDPQTGALINHEDSFLFSHLLCEALLRLYDVTHDEKYLDAVRRTASYAYRHFRDSSGEYWGTAKQASEASGSRTLIQLASIARVYWMLAEYADPDDLYRNAMEKIEKGDEAGGADLLKQVAQSDPENVGARYALYESDKKLGRAADSQADEQDMEQLAQNANYLAELNKLGWRGATPGK